MVKNDQHKPLLGPEVVGGSLYQKSICMPVLHFYVSFMAFIWIPHTIANPHTHIIFHKKLCTANKSSGSTAESLQFTIDSSNPLGSVSILTIADRCAPYNPYNICYVLFDNLWVFLILMVVALSCLGLLWVAYFWINQTRYQQLESRFNVEMQN